MCYHYLVGVVEEVNRDTEWQRVMIGVPQQDRKDLHTGRPGLPLTLLLGPLHGPLAVDGILTHLSPEDNREVRKYDYLFNRIQLQKLKIQKLKASTFKATKIEKSN